MIVIVIVIVMMTCNNSVYVQCYLYGYIPKTKFIYYTRFHWNFQSLSPSVAMAQPMFSPENGHSVTNKIANILRIFQGVEGDKRRGACFGTKESDHPFLGYSHSFDLAHSLAPNQSCVNIPGMGNPIS